MNDPAIDKVARELLAARREKRQHDDAPFAETLRSPEEAYAVQRFVARELGETEPARHWKSGGPSREGVLTHAPLPAAGVWPSPADARNVPFNLRLIEAEIALRLGRDVTAQDAAALSPENARNLVAAMTVSIEVVDSRWKQGPQAPALLKLADLQCRGALVLGEWIPFEPRDWSAQVCAVQIGERAPREFRGTHSLRDPAWLLPQWLRHATQGGVTIPRGTVVTTGTWCGMLPAAAGDLVTVRFDGVGEASVQL